MGKSIGFTKRVSKWQGDSRGLQCGKKQRGTVWKFKDGCRRSSSHRTDIAVKLKKLKSKLKSWNHNSCENFDVCIRKLENRIDELEEVGSEEYAALNKDEELKECKLKLWDTLKLQEDLWR
ncbi:hypothetical protein V6N13_028582 [Hibiscus sabdariffa]